jgi:hypothetical protein
MTLTPQWHESRNGTQIGRTYSEETQLPSQTVGDRKGSQNQKSELRTRDKRRGRVDRIDSSLQPDLSSSIWLVFCCGGFLVIRNVKFVDHSIPEAEVPVMILGSDFYESQNFGPGDYKVRLTNFKLCVSFNDPSSIKICVRIFLQFPDSSTGLASPFEPSSRHPYTRNISSFIGF